MKNLLPILVALFFTACQSTKKHADFIIHNATVYTVDSAFTTASAIAVKNGKILEVGGDELLSKYQSDSLVNLKKQFVYPGFIDAHCHFFGYSMNLRQVNLRGTESFDEIIEMLKKWNEKYNPEWILGRGWDQNDWTNKEFPNRKKLDEIFPDKPVYLRRVDGHAAIVNGKALEVAGLKQAPKIDGGLVETKNGRATGILIDNAMEFVEKKIEESPVQEQVEYLKKGQANCFAVGLTSVSDAGLPYNQVHLMDSLHENGELKIQVYAMLSPTKKNFKQYMEKGIYRTNRLHVRSVKMFADGALGSRGACLLEPYTDDPGNTGIIVTPIQEMERIARKAYENNYQVNTHAIGDSANRVVLHLYGKILQKENDRRWRIEHAQVVNPADINLFGKYNIVPAINTTHATSDMYWADERLGEDRIKHAYAYQDLLQQNGWLCNGSDFPVEEINPMYGFYAAVARKDKKGYPENGWQTENSLTRKQALKAMTIWAAKSMFEEDVKGSIEKGKNADFVVLDRDIMNVPQAELHSPQILKTYVQGECVYKKGS